MKELRKRQLERIEHKQKLSRIRDDLECVECGDRECKEGFCHHCNKCWECIEKEEKLK